MTSSAEGAREAFARGSWREAFSGFSAAAERGELAAADQERLAVCAYLVGEDDRCSAAWELAHRGALEADDQPRAARCAFWLAVCLMLRGRTAQAGGWLSRIERLVEGAGQDSAASGYLLVPRVLGSLGAGDPGTARDLALRATELGEHFDDADLRAFGLLGQGQALIAMGESRRGISRLDEVMVSVIAGEVGPITSGLVYCAVILECMRLFDLHRASEWTGALTAWCDAQPDLVPFRGQCLVHRSQLLQAAGQWPGAMTTAAAACRRLTDPPHPALGLAHYQQAELHRLTGAFEAAETAYRHASRNGHHPMPGLALLHLARGDTDGAAASIRRALQEAGLAQHRPALLSAAVDIFCATGDLSAARSAADQLEAIAATAASDVLGAMAAQATGAVLAEEGDPAAGLTKLRAAGNAWQSLQMPYEAARAALSRGLACAAMGDPASAAVELDNSRDIFTRLGAVTDLDRLTALTRAAAGVGAPPAPAPEGAPDLSVREREVLSHLAAGRTNREIAAELTISQHTVGRHVEHIFTKLGVTSRAAATSFAYEHHLLPRPDQAR